MNDEFTKDNLQRVIGKRSFKKRLLVWDAYRCHVSQSIKDELKHNYNITTGLIPGGCTKHLQAPDVCWNKPFKDRLHELYDVWMAGDDNKEYTAGGNLKAPSFELMLSWVTIRKSFVVCGHISGTSPQLNSLNIIIVAL
jgi:hypothetical protein